MAIDNIPWATLYIASEWALRISALILVPRRRTAASARAWLLLILFWPWPGLVVYLLIGRAYLPRHRLALQRRIRDTIRRVEPRALGGSRAAWGGTSQADPPALGLAPQPPQF